MADQIDIRPSGPHGYPSIKETPETPSGLFTVGNRTYSGADIKLVYHNRMSEYSEKLINEIQKGYEAKAPEERYEGELEGINKVIEQLREKNPSYLPIATAQTLSLQIHSTKLPIRALGFKSPKSFTRGPRMIAGTMVLTVFHEHPLVNMLMSPASSWSHDQDNRVRPFIGLPDQLPPFTVTVTMTNESGYNSQMNIYGVEFINDGTVLSIHDIFTEETLTFVARDYDPLVCNGRLKDQSPGGEWNLDQNSASSLLKSAEYKDYMNRFSVRRNPYG